MRNEQTFEAVFKNYLDFLRGVHASADSFVRRDETVVASYAYRTPLLLRIISDKAGEARQIEKCIGRIITGHKVWTDISGNIESAAREMEEIRAGDIARQNKLFAIVTDGDDLPDVLGKFSCITGDFYAVCFVRVSARIISGGSWQVPTEWIRAFLGLKGCFKYGVYFVLDSLCFQSGFEETVAAGLVTVSQVFDRGRADTPSIPVRLTGRVSDMNTFAVLSASSVNVCRIGVLLTCAGRIRKKLDSGDDPDDSVRKPLSEVCRADDLRRQIENVFEKIMSSVDLADVFSEMASMPVDGSCESRLADIRAGQKGGLLSFFRAKQEPKDLSLRGILGIDSCDRRFDEYYEKKVVDTWEKAIDDWFGNSENLYGFFYDMLNCFADFDSARANWSAAIQKVREEHEENIPANQPGTAAVYTGENTVRQIAEHYIRSVYGARTQYEQNRLFSKITDKLLSHEAEGEFRSIIDVLINTSRSVSNRIWDDFHDEIIGFRNGMYTGNDDLSDIGDLYDDGSSENRLLDVPDVDRFILNESRIATMRDSLSKDADRVPCLVTTAYDTPCLSGEWVIRDENDNVVESFDNGRICFVIRCSNRHRFYRAFDKQRVIRVKINIYRIDNIEEFNS